MSPKVVQEDYEPKEGCDETSCVECRNKYWFEELEEFE